MSSGIIETASGAFLDIMNPKAEDVSMDDIDFALRRIYRFGGHANYTVLQHSLSVFEICYTLYNENPSHQLRLAALLHDAAEAYIGDIPTPIKNLIPGIEDIEINILKAIYEHLGLSWEDAQPSSIEMDVLKYADAIALVEEARVFLRSKGRNADYWGTLAEDLSAHPFAQNPNCRFEAYKEFVRERLYKWKELVEVSVRKLK